MQDSGSRSCISKISHRNLLEHLFYGKTDRNVKTLKHWAIFINIETGSNPDIHKLNRAGLFLVLMHGFKYSLSFRIECTGFYLYLN